MYVKDLKLRKETLILKAVSIVKIQLVNQVNKTESSTC